MTLTYGSRTKAVRLIRQSVTWEKQPIISDKVVVWHGNNNPLDLTHSPAPFSGISDSHSITMGDSLFLKVSNTGTRILPLFPNHGSKSAKNHSVKRTEHTSCMSYLEIVPPATGIKVQLIYYLFNTSTTVSWNKLSDSRFKLIYCFRVNADSWIISIGSKTESKIAAPPWMAYCTLLFINFQPKFTGNGKRKICPYI